MTVPTTAATATHGDLPESAARLEAFQVEPQAPPLEPDHVKQASSEQTTAETDRIADMDEFIKEVFIKVFIMNKADSMNRVLAPFPQPSTHKSPASETPAPAVPPAFRNQDPESAYDPIPDTSAQPDPDAAIDWLIRKKSR